MQVSPEYKIILLGEPGVGKTNFFLRLRNGTFAGSSAVTASLGTDRLEYSMNIHGIAVKVRCHFYHVFLKDQCLTCANEEQLANCLKLSSEFHIALISAFFWIFLVGMNWLGWREPWLEGCL